MVVAGIAKVWLTEDELFVLVKALRWNTNLDAEENLTRRALLDKLGPLAEGLSCEVSSEGGAQCVVGGCPDGNQYCDGSDLLHGEWCKQSAALSTAMCEGDLLTELK